MITEAESPETACIDQQLAELRELKRELIYREQDLTQQRIALVQGMEQ